jgi:cyclohexa-1,5-dienecarbonyl-CoA hydratase
MNPRFHRISLTSSPPVARITFTNPPLNVIDLAMMDELAAAFEEINHRPEISIVFFAGSDRAFSAGVDVAAHAPDHIAEMLSKFHAVIKQIVTWNRISVAEVRGKCLGGGAELAMVCDFVVTAEDATWGFPEIKLGCFPPVAATALASLVGQKRAMDLILTGRTLDGREADSLRLVTSAAPSHQVGTTIEELISRLNALSPAALALTRKAIYAWDSMHFDKGLARAEKIYLEELMRTSDAHEGIRAFLEKRPSRWEGK